MGEGCMSDKCCWVVGESAIWNTVLPKTAIDILYKNSTYGVLAYIEICYKYGYKLYINGEVFYTP